MIKKNRYTKLRVNSTALKATTSILFLLLQVTTGTSQTPLKGVTFGFAAGYHYSLSRTYDYFLVPDDNYKLNITTQPRGAFVISSMINVKVRKLVYAEGALNKAIGPPTSTQGIEDTFDKTGKLIATTKVVRTAVPYTKANWKDKITFHVGLNLAEIAPSVTFNKTIDGGIGIGYLLSENSHIVLMGDFNKIRKIRQYFVDKYEGKAIPNGSSVYTTLNVDDSNLFQNKTNFGLSLKIVFSL
jgi:hypothetical protein